VTYDLANVVAECHSLWQSFRRWGLRFYAGAFISIGFLFVARAVRHHDVVRVIAKAFAGTVGAIAVVFGVIAYSYVWGAQTWLFPAQPAADATSASETLRTDTARQRTARNLTWILRGQPRSRLNIELNKVFAVAASPFSGVIRAL
jgi:hypothetical protein